MKRLSILLNLGSGGNPLPGFANLDLPDWQYEMGLTTYKDRSVDGITISHSLMYLPSEDWDAAFKEFYRVLKRGAVIRITEDNTQDERSERKGGYSDAVTLTSPQMIRSYLEAAGFKKIFDVSEQESRATTDVLRQSWHGAPPKVFYIEAIK